MRLAGAVLLSLLPLAHAWSVPFGDCSFTNDGSGGLVRAGLCSGQGGFLGLGSMVGRDDLGITSIPADAFAGMGSMT